jgi:phosphate transport system protein
MSSNKDLALEVMNSEFEKMSNLVLTQLDILDKIIESDDGKKIKEWGKTLILNEKDLDNLEIILDNKIIQAIVLYNPVASELRHIFALYRMVINLERIGDLVVKIYHFSQDLKGKYIAGKPTQYLLTMLRTTTKMVRNSILSFMNNNVETAIKTIEKDNEIDSLNQKILKKTLANLEINKESQELIFNFVDIRSMVSSIERIGDQATNMAEASIYAITGTNIAHKDINEIK